MSYGLYFSAGYINFMFFTTSEYTIQSYSFQGTLSTPLKLDFHSDTRKPHKNVTLSQCSFYLKVTTVEPGNF